MANPTMKLDTLSYSKKLIEAGCEPKLAEAHASLQQDVWIEVSEDYLSQLATHQDLEGTNQNIERLRISTKHDLAMLEQRIETKIANASAKTIRTLGAIVVATATILFGALGILIQLHL